MGSTKTSSTSKNEKGSTKKSTNDHKPRESSKKASSKKKEGTSVKSSVSTTTTVDVSLKLALVDDDSDNGRIDSNTVEIFEETYLQKISEITEEVDDGEELYSDAIWEEGMRIYVCSNEKSKLFLHECFRQDK